MSNNGKRKRSRRSYEAARSEPNQGQIAAKTVLKRPKSGRRRTRKSGRIQQIRISRDVKVKYYTRYHRRGMKSTLVETQCQLFQSNYKTYIRKILRHVHKNMQISRESMDQMNGFMNYLFNALASDASQRARRRRLKTITGRDVQDAIKSRFPGNIKIFAVLNAIGTLNKFIQNNERRQ